MRRPRGLRRQAGKVAKAALPAALVLAFAGCALGTRSLPERVAETPVSSPWARHALADLAAIRASLQDHHPGPVDPLNPAYGKWLNEGYRRALKLARTATTAADYDRTISFYVNGFRDLHINWWMNQPQPKLWPGFLVSDVEDGRIEVTAASSGSPVAVGSRLAGCDGKPISRLLDRQLYRFKVNPDIPHLALWWAAEFLVRYADDAQKPERCTFETAGGRREVTLAWTPIADAVLARQLKLARPFPSGELGIHEHGGTYLISIPSFQFSGEGVGRIQNFLTALEQKRDEIRRADAVIIDVRGNTGGNSAWGSRAARILWDAARIDPIVNSFDWTTEYRASPKIEERWRLYGDTMKKAGEQEQAERNYRIADGIKAARAAGRALWLNPNPPKSSRADYPTTTPFSNPVYFLTDERCASACLDFADILTRLPGVIHIGRNTLADAIYIDNLAEPLPSGVATFTWSAKVYRNRVRANNQWYTPAHRLRRDQMTTQAVLEWVAARTGRQG